MTQRPQRPLASPPRVIVTRQLIPGVEERMRELFDVVLNAADVPLTRDQLAAAMQAAAASPPTGTSSMRTSHRGTPPMDSVPGASLGSEPTVVGSGGSARAFADGGATTGSGTRGVGATGSGVGATGAAGGGGAARRCIATGTVWSRSGTS